MHYFIDEGGDLGLGRGASSYFSISCVVTDSPGEALREIKNLRQQILNSAAMSRHWKAFRKQGFHATSNHPDIYNKFMSFLNIISFRAYFVLISKKTPEFKRLIKQIKPNVLYDELIRAVLLDRIIKDNGKRITVSFEQNLPLPSLGRLAHRRLVIRSILRQTVKQALAKKRKSRKPTIVVRLEDKSTELRLALPDYMNHILLKYVEVRGRMPYQAQNYKLLEKKIGLIHDYLAHKFFQPRKHPFIR